MFISYDLRASLLKDILCFRNVSVYIPVDTEENTHQQKLEDFPGGPVDKNPPANDTYMSLIPGPGRFHMLQSNQAHVPQLLKPAHSRAHAPQREATTMRRPCTTLREKPPLAATRKSLHIATDTVQPKIKS